MKRQDLNKIITGDFMLFKHNSANFVEETISQSENLNFGVMNSNYSHFEFMETDTEMAGMNPPKPYIRQLSSLSDDDLSRIDVYRPYLPPAFALSQPWAPGFNGLFRKFILRSTMSHMGEFYDFPLIGWFAGAKFFDWISCPKIASWMYSRNRDSQSHFDVCSSWGLKIWREAVRNAFGLDYDMDGNATGRGMETPASIGGSAWLVRIA